MKKAIAAGLLLLSVFCCSAQGVSGYRSLDAKHPIFFGGTYIVYNGDSVRLGKKAFFIDGQLSDAEVSKYSFVFNSFSKAAEQLTDGTEDAPMVLYLAPYVYWIDDPDDPAIRVSKGSEQPYGMTIKCEWLKFYGLNNDAKNVVLASNRGQTIGALGNFTMFKFIGQGTGSENITFGNYCNVDLEYPLLPKLSRKKRASAIVQAQLIHCNGDKIVARNTRFISRLNLCPFTGGKRVLFDRCHFESTDDALCGIGVYLNSTVDFYASKPFYRTNGTGAVFLNCDIRLFSGNQQFFTKANGQLAVIDTRITSPAKPYIGWNEVVPAETRNYQFNVTLNGKPLFIGKNDPASTVDMTGIRIKDAYRVTHNGKVVYNTYNLLAGHDDWDPMGIREMILAAEKVSNKTYTKLPVQLLISPTRVSMETKKNDVQLTAKVNRFGNYESNGETIKWAVAPEEYKSLVALEASEDGALCKVIPMNNSDETKQVIVTAYTASGLQAASVVTVTPSILAAPKFSSSPAVSLVDGKLHADYKLDTRYKDQSVVTWYRCRDAKGSEPIEVAVSRFNTPLLDYTLSEGDIGHHIMITVAPKHIRSHTGEAVRFLMKNPISMKDVRTNSNVLFTDFRNMSTKNQPHVIPGFWTWEHFDAPENEARYKADKDADAWYYGEGSDGAANLFGLLQGRSGAMRYTPVGSKFGDMKLTMNVAPFKTAGQGFSVANLYMDVLIKLDTKTMTGYAVRFIRTTKHHDAVDVILLKYENGKVEEMTQPVTTGSFRPPCKIVVEVNNNKIRAACATTAQYSQSTNPGVLNEVNIETTITPNAFGGFGIQYNGGSPTLIKDLKVEWKQ